MLNKYSYRKKTKLIAPLGVLSIFLCYRLAIARTIEEYQTFKKHATLSRQKDGQPQAAEILSKNERINTILRQYTLDTLLPEKNLLSIAGNFCKMNALRLKEYVPLSTTPHDSLPLLTRTVTVEGAFIPCLKFVHALESTKMAGRPASVTFKTSVDPKDKEPRLACTVYIQNLMPGNHEQN